MEGRISLNENNHDQLNNIPADLTQSWHIPRPTLARSSNSSKGSTSSNNSTQSAKSGSLLLTAANLAQIHRTDGKTQRQENLFYYLQQTGGVNADIVLDKNFKEPEADTLSIASSMHFTVVNVNSRTRPLKRSFCTKHQLTVLIVSMSLVFTFGILAAIYFVEMRVRTPN